MEYPIEIFRAGTRTDAAGNEHKFSVADLQEIADAYNETRDKSPAPFVLGHPKGNGPAYGWAGGLSVKGDRLYLDDGHQVEPSFGEWLKQGRYKNRSISIFPRESTANPTPGRLNMRHLGWLGDTRPAVPNMDVINHGDGEGAITFDFNEDQGNGVLSALASLVAPLMRKEPPNNPDKDVDMSEHTETIAELQKQLKTAQDEAAEAKLEAEQAAADFAEKQRRDQAMEFAAKMVKDDHILPAQSAAIQEIAFALGAEPYEFSEGDTKTKALDAFKTLVEGLKADIDFSDKSGKAKKTTGELDFSSPEADAAIEAYKDKHGCSYREAAIALQNQAAA